MSAVLTLRDGNASTTAESPVVVASSDINLALSFQEDDPNDKIEGYVPEKIYGFRKKGVVTYTAIVQKTADATPETVITYDVSLSVSGEGAESPLDGHSSFDVVITPKIPNAGICGDFVDVQLAVKSGTAKDAQGNSNLQSEIVYVRWSPGEAILPGQGLK